MRVVMGKEEMHSFVTSQGAEKEKGGGTNQKEMFDSLKTQLPPQISRNIQGQEDVR